MFKDFLKTVFLWDLVQGMRLTFRYQFKKVITMHYPDKEKWVPYDRFRGLHYQAVDEEGEMKCVACELCARICPAGVITIEAYEDDKGVRRPSLYEMDLHRCAYCGLCVEVCPEDAINHGQGYEFAGFERADAVMSLEKLLKNKPNETDPEKMGTVATAKFIRDKDGIRVEEDGKKRYRWW